MDLKRIAGDIDCYVQELVDRIEELESEASDFEDDKNKINCLEDEITELTKTIELQDQELDEARFLIEELKEKLKNAGYELY